MNPRPVLALGVNSARFFLSHRLGLATEAKERGYQVFVLCPPGAEVPKIQELGFEVKTIGLSRKGTQFIAELQTIVRFYKALRKIKPSIYHGFTIKPVIYGALAGRLAGVPKIFCTITGLGYVFIDENKRARILRKIIGALYKTVFRSSKVNVIFQNTDDRNLFIDRGWTRGEQSHLIAGTGVDLKAFFPEEPSTTSTVKILFPARLLAHKGIAELVRAGETLNSQGKNFLISICGDLDEQNPSHVTEKEITTWKQLPFLQFLGHQQKMRDVFVAHDIVCLPSYREGIPLALMEAAACAKPIVTTDSPGCRDVVNNGENGFLVPVKNVHELTRTLGILLDSRELRLRMGQASLAKAQAQFNKEHVLQKHFDLYKK